MHTKQMLAGGLPACTLFILIAASGSPVGAQDLTGPLTADQVGCEELQLERLAKRWVVVEQDPQKQGQAVNPSLFLWRSTTAGGVYGGIAVTDSLGADHSPRRNELQLAFDLVLQQSANVLNPARPPLPQGALVRRGAESNLIVAGTVPSLAVSMDLAPQVPDPFVPAIPLAINNLAAAGQPASGSSVPMDAADAVGRGVAVDDLTAACHASYTAMDERIFSLIARMLRASQCLSTAGCLGADPTAYNITLFRDTDPHTYRANVYLYEKVCGSGSCSSGVYGKVALQLVIGWSPDGTLSNGQVTVLPLCQTGQSTECSDYQVAEVALYVLPPLFAGTQQQGPAVFARSPHLDVEGAGLTNILTAPVDWQTLLAATAWN
jgi:hypothetical protein